MSDQEYRIMSEWLRMNGNEMCRHGRVFMAGKASQDAMNQGRLSTHIETVASVGWGPWMYQTPYHLWKAGRTRRIGARASWGGLDFTTPLDDHDSGYCTKMLVSQHETRGSLLGEVLRPLKQAGIRLCLSAVLGSY